MLVMKTLTLWQIAMRPWYLFLAYWLVSAFRVKIAKVEESRLSRLETTVLVGLAFVLLFSHRLRDGWLGMRFAPASSALADWGIGLSFAGVAIAIWARYVLGEYWSARVTLKVDHKLIRSGLYAYIRHPIYTGLLLAMVGTALVVGEWHAVLGVLLGVVAISRKALKEELLLSTEFGTEYQEYRRRTGFLLPHFH
jgi:protein-S-isoprenylcysteine O-methyltransferase Ste14